MPGSSPLSRRRLVIASGGVAAALSPLLELVGRVHRAGTETSEIWAGYMDGAVRSGERVAIEIGKALEAESTMENRTR